jgi:hypothetical protein
MQVDAVAPGVFWITGHFPAPAGGSASDERIVSIYATGFGDAIPMNVKCSFPDLFSAFVGVPCTIENAVPEAIPGLSRFDIRVPASVVRYVSNPPTSAYPVDVTLSIEGLLANSVPLTAPAFR